MVELLHMTVRYGPHIVGRKGLSETHGVFVPRAGSAYLGAMLAPTENRTRILCQEKINR